MSPRERAYLAERAANEFARLGLARFAADARRHADALRAADPCGRPHRPNRRMPPGHVAEVIVLAAHRAAPAIPIAPIPAAGRADAQPCQPKARR